MKKQAKSKVKAKKLIAIDKIKAVIKTAKKNKEKRVQVMKLTRKDFNEKLSCSTGFGFQDMKPINKDLYVWLLKNYSKSIQVLPISIPDLKVEISVKP